MDREDFEGLRDLPNKEVTQDIVFLTRGQTKLVHEADGIPILNGDGENLIVNLRYNEARQSATINVVLQGKGPICRIDVRSNVHKDAGRNHKHSFYEERDWIDNLPQAEARNDLAKCNIEELWDHFCEEAKITHTGSFVQIKNVRPSDPSIPKEVS